MFGGGMTIVYGSLSYSGSALIGCSAQRRALLASTSRGVYELASAPAACSGPAVASVMRLKPPPDQLIAAQRVLATHDRQRHQRLLTDPASEAARRAAQLEAHRVVRFRDHQRGAAITGGPQGAADRYLDRKSTRLNSSHVASSYAVF